MLQVIDIFKEYDNKPLLNGLSFQVNQGELVCLLGSSGSGKSTMLRIIAGLEDPESGSVVWDQQDITHLPVHERGFGLMFQDYALFPHKTVAQNIAFGLRMANRSEEDIQKIVRQSLESIRMENFADRPVTELSGGEQQRVALARALAPDPCLLMLDEPLGALDHNLRTELIKELRRRLRESQKPVIYVTHDQEEAFALADRLLLLHQGKLVQEGTPAEVFLHPANTWVASFLGLGNLIAATIPENQRVRTALGEFDLPCPKAFEKGATLRLLLRQEGVGINQEADARSLTVPAVVTDSVFLGEYYRLEVLANQQKLLVHADRAYPKGSQVSLTWHMDEILCLPDDAL